MRKFETISLLKRTTGHVPSALSFTLDPACALSENTNNQGDGKVPMTHVINKHWSRNHY